ncbi:MAG: SpoIID/LytB domain protein [Myxococcota bacterium]
MSQAPQAQQPHWLPLHQLSLCRLALYWLCVWGLLCAASTQVSAAAPEAAHVVRVRVVTDEPWVEIRGQVGGPVRITAAKGGLAIDGRKVGREWRSSDNSPFVIKTAGGGNLKVRDGLVVRRSAGGVSVNNRVSLENYVAGTLGGEMISSWEQAALRAQAVACRSYVLYQMGERTGEPYDVSADVLSQRYLGVRGESNPGWRAVRATTGEILSYAGRPALAAFHSASGGHSASAAEVWGTRVPYLTSAPVSYEDDSPDTFWRVAIADEIMAEGLATLGHRIGKIEQIKVVKRSSSGRVGKLRFRGTKGRATVTGREIRQVLGSVTIRSTLFEIKRGDGQVVFVGSGHGHGVGMSQWAAQGMAQEGEGYREILGKFYPGTDIVKVVDLTRRFAKLPAVSLPAKPGRAGHVDSLSTVDAGRTKQDKALGGNVRSTDKKDRIGDRQQ